MRKITRDALAAFVEGRPFSRGNTSVTHNEVTGVTCLLLHGKRSHVGIRMVTMKLLKLLMLVGKQ